MRFIEAELPGVILIEPDVFEDPRGYFLETYQEKKYAARGICAHFVQDNFSKSVCGALRGLHYQLTNPQGMLVTALEGRVYDVAVDIRKESPTFGKWCSIELSAENKRQVYIPPGFAHGFCVLSDSAGMYYKCTDVYSPTGERGIQWNDPVISIPWPIAKPLLSRKDQSYKTLAEMADDLPLYHK